MTNLRETLGKQLRKRRAELGWTQEELADRARISARHLGAAERADGSITVDVLEQLAEAFGVPAADLLRE